jgi:hypothetical protein
MFGFRYRLVFSVSDLANPLQNPPRLAAGSFTVSDLEFCPYLTAALQHRRTNLLQHQYTFTLEAPFLSS